MSIVIGSMSDDESAAADTHLDKKLLQEFADLSEDVLHKIGRGDVIGQKAISFLADMEAKAANFSFLSDTWIGLAACLNEMRNSFPKNGQLDSKSLGLLRLLLTSLSNKTALETLLTSYDELGLEAMVEPEIVNEPMAEIDEDVAQLLHALRGSTEYGGETEVTTAKVTEEVEHSELSAELDTAFAAFFK